MFVAVLIGQYTTTPLARCQNRYAAVNCRIAIAARGRDSFASNRHVQRARKRKRF
jgi:hypothetical protein